MLSPLQQAGQFFAQEPSVSVDETHSFQLVNLSTDVQSDQNHAAPVSFAVYVWNYDALLMQSELWAQSRELGIKRILLSLNDKEIAEIVANASELNTLMRAARRHGVKIELLLGDPDWILPEKRDNLLQIIQRLNHIDFDGLHLDIEPDQLEIGPAGKERLVAFIESIRQAAAVSPWPVGVSMHPRYLEAQSSHQLCIPCELKRSGVQEIAVMYYSMNIENIVMALKSAMHRHPGLIFSLAQSMERELGPENSYATKPPTAFGQAMLRLNNQLQSSNFGGLIIQSWQEWKIYRNENPF